jgi:hypothetical protein
MNNFEPRPPAFLDGKKVEPHKAEPLELQHLTKGEIDKYGGNIIDVEATEVKKEPKQLPPAEH